MTSTPLNEEALAKSADAVEKMAKRIGVRLYGADEDILAEAAVSAYLSAVPADTVNPSELNRRGWTCGCEPGDYDKCEDCQSACDELADFLNRLEATK